MYVCMYGGGGGGRGVGGGMGYKFSSVVSRDKTNP